MFRTRAQNSSFFQEPKSPWLAHSIGDATQNIAKKKKRRTLLDKITSLQKYKQEGLKQTTFVCSSLKINEQVNELCEGKLEKKKKTEQQQQQQNRGRERERVLDKHFRLLALAGNRTRASRVAGENSTTEPPVPFDGVPSVLTKKIA